MHEAARADARRGDGGDRQRLTRTLWKLLALRLIGQSRLDPKVVGETGQTLHDVAAELLLEHRQHPMPNSIAGEPWIVVRPVVDMGEATRRQVRRAFSAAEAEQRPNEAIGAPHLHRRERPRPGSPSEPVQQRLGLIVARVPNRNRGGAHLLRNIGEEREPNLAATRLEVRAFQQVWFDSVAMEGQRPRTRSLPHERFVPIRLRAAETMVHVGDVQIERELVRSSERVQSREESARVRAPRNAHDDRVSGPQAGFPL